MDWFRFPAVKILRLLLFCCFLSWSPLTSGVHRIQYQSPVPGADYIRPATELCFRLTEPTGQTELDQLSRLRVAGSRTGVHTGQAVASDDHHTLIFKPATPFSPGERVHVLLPEGWMTGPSGGTPETGSFEFTISTVREQQAALSYGSNEDAALLPQKDWSPQGRTVSSALDSLPLDFPLLHISTFDSTAVGEIFISNFTFLSSIPSTPYLLIVDNAGSPVYYKKMRSSCFDFKMQPNGLLTYYELGVQRFYAMDSTYTIVDSFACGNGYVTDVHELRILQNGHALLMSYDTERVDMRTVVQGGDSNANVVGLIIQEIDQNKNVVFQWRSWDHFQITDETHENLLASTIDYVHGNAIELDMDGNLLISSRHMDEITKIDRATGNIIWRLGGKNNQFTFLNDSIGFSHQHAIRRLPNGNITLYDNGNFHTPRFSRAVEYQLDEEQKTATLVWQYRNHPDIFGGAMGYAQRLENGNTLIGWGASNPSVTEVRADGTKVFELSYDTGIYSYRAYRFPWKNHLTSSPGSEPQAYYLSQNYPNPFNNSTSILIDIPFESNISLKIYDTQGRKVQTIADGVRRSKGQFFFTMDGSTLASGVYFYRLVGDGFIQMRKMILTK